MVKRRFSQFSHDMCRNVAKSDYATFEQGVGYRETDKKRELGCRERLFHIPSCGSVALWPFPLSQSSCCWRPFCAGTGGANSPEGVGAKSCALAGAACAKHVQAKVIARMTPDGFFLIRLDLTDDELALPYRSGSTV
jgi:hypothetical protein